MRRVSASAAQVRSLTICAAQCANVSLSGTWTSVRNPFRGKHETRHANCIPCLDVTSDTVMKTSSRLSVSDIRHLSFLLLWWLPRASIYSRYSHIRLADVTDGYLAGV